MENEKKNNSYLLFVWLGLLFFRGVLHFYCTTRRERKSQTDKSDNAKMPQISSNDLLDYFSA